MLAALVALFLTTGAVSAAGPDMIGGELKAGGSRASLTSTATIPVAVTMAASDATVSPQRFTLDPGETVQMRLTGPELGTLTANLSSLSPAAGSDASSVTLTLNLRQAPRPTVPVGPIIFALLLLAGAALVLRRLRPWELRVTRA